MEVWIETGEEVWAEIGVEIWAKAGVGKKVPRQKRYVYFGADFRTRLTNASCTAPQKHVAVASSSLDQPSSAQPARGM